MILSMLLAATMPLEWNTAYDTSVPYELELNPSKLEKLAGVKPGTGFSVKAKTAAGEKAVPVATFPGRLPGDHGLRFSVPDGTTALALEAGVGRCTDADTQTLDNLFVHGLSAAAWKLPANVRATEQDGAILFETKGYTVENITLEAAVPAALRGKSAKLEFTVKSLTPMTWGSRCALRQYDAAGNELPEDVVDPRTISHMRPKDYVTAYREFGRFHPLAAKAVLSIELRSVEFPVDAYGLARTDADQSRARLVLSHVALRGAAPMPFPKYDDANFTAGPSGRADDTALTLGGEDVRSFYYATHSQASWAQGNPLRDEKLNFYPEGACTVEAWFKPDWSRFAAKAGKDRFCRLFVTDQNYKAAEWKSGLGRLLDLSYYPDRKELHLFLCDWKGNKFEASGAAEMPDGVWTHVAVQYAPGGAAEAFVAGKKVLSMPVKGYEVFDLKDESFKYPNDQTHMEFFLGACAMGGRGNVTVPAVNAVFEGAADLLRVSSGTRYPADFAPATAFALDEATRALFTFDRTFDGVSGGGIGYVRGTTRSFGAGRVARRLVVDGKEVQYYPAEISDAADPRKVLDLNNYPDAPKRAEFDMARVRKDKDQTMRPGEKMKITVPEGTVTDAITIENKGDRPLLYPALVGRGDLDVRSFADAADSLSVGNLPDRERANRLYQFVIGASDYYMDHNVSFAPGTDTWREELGIPLLMLNGYCGFECGPLNNLTANLFACAVRCPAGQTAGYGHSFEQVFYDGKNHIYDLANQAFFPAMDNETASSLYESEDEPGSHHRIGKSPDHFTRRSMRTAYVQTPGYQEKMGMVLNPGERFRVHFANNGEQNDIQNIPPASFGPDQSKFPNMPWLVDYTDKVHAGPNQRKLYRVNRFFPDFSSGFLEFEGRPDAANPAFVRIESDSFCYAVKSAFPIVWAKYEAELKDGGKAALEISTDRGKTFRAIPEELRYEVRVRYEYLVRVKAPIAQVKEFEAKTEVMVNRRVFPGRLVAGENELLFKADSEGEAKVTVDWREPAGKITVSGVASSGFLPGCERQLVLVEPGKSVTLAVGGVSSKAKAKSAEEGLKAALKDGRLVLTAAKGAEPHFTAVVIADGKRMKMLTVLVCKGARFALFDRAALAGGAAILPPDASSPQARAMLKGPDDRATVSFEKLPAGRYMVYQLERFEGGTLTIPKSASVLRMEDPSKPGAFLNVGTPNAAQHDFMSAPNGEQGGRGAWKWDSGVDKRRTYMVSWLSRRYDFPEFDKLTFSCDREVKKGVEVAAVLVVPDPSVDFYCELVKILCGMNCDPWRVTK